LDEKLRNNGAWEFPSGQDIDPDFDNNDFVDTSNFSDKQKVEGKNTSSQKLGDKVEEVRTRNDF
jgi:hypothetical protein